MRRFRWLILGALAGWLMADLLTPAVGDGLDPFEGMRNVLVPLGGAAGGLLIGWWLSILLPGRER